MPTETNQSAGQLELSIFNSRNGALTKALSFEDNDIIIREDLSYEEWNDGLRLFKWAHDKLDAGFAQYLKFGEIKFGKIKAEQSVAQLELPMTFVTRAIALSSVPKSVRQEGLKSEHYVVLGKAGIAVKEQAKWAKTAIDQSLTPSQLKHSIEAGEVVTTDTAKKNTHGIINIHGLLSEFNIWLGRVGGIDGIRKMDPDAQKEITGLLRPIAALYAEIIAGLEQPVDIPAEES